MDRSLSGYSCVGGGEVVTQVLILGLGVWMRCPCADWTEARLFRWIRHAGSQKNHGILGLEILIGGYPGNVLTKYYLKATLLYRGDWVDTVSRSICCFHFKQAILALFVILARLVAGPRPVGPPEPPHYLRKVLRKFPYPPQFLSDFHITRVGDPNLNRPLEGSIPPEPNLPLNRFITPTPSTDINYHLRFTSTQT